MKRLLCLVILAAVQTSCLMPSVIQGSGKEVRGEFDIAQGYTSLAVSSGIAVELMLSDGGTGTIVADEKVLPFVSIVEEGGHVRVSYDPSISVSSPVNTVVSLPLSTRLDHIDASAAGRVVSGRRVVARAMSIDASSAGRVELDIDAEELRLNLSNAASFGGNVAVGSLEVDLSSASSCEMEGTAERLRVNANSAAGFRAPGLAVLHATVDASSGGKVEITVTEDIAANASSGGSVDYGGNPAIVRRNATSGGSVRATSGRSR